MPHWRHNRLPLSIVLEIGKPSLHIWKKKGSKMTYRALGFFTIGFHVCFLSLYPSFSVWVDCLNTANYRVRFQIINNLLLVLQTITITWTKFILPLRQQVYYGHLKGVIPNLLDDAVKVICMPRFNYEINEENKWISNDLVCSNFESISIVLHLGILNTFNLILYFIIVFFWKKNYIYFMFWLILNTFNLIVFSIANLVLLSIQIISFKYIQMVI